MVASVLSSFFLLSPGRHFLWSPDHGSDIVASISALAERLEVRCGTVSAIGALMYATLGFYDQGAHEYRTIEINRPVEIANLTGNVSIRDGRPFLHAHATLADSKGEVMGGHLIRGTVFAAEVHLRELLGAAPVRSHDPTTDLFLWRDGD
jgi:predicted DNA-binding protein with PD1-like motif